MLTLLPYEISLVLRRMFRRRTQTALMFATFGVSIGVSLLSWSLFHAIFLRHPAFDPQGRLCIVEQQPEAEYWMPSTRDEIDDWQAQQTVFSDFAPVVLYNSSFLSHGDGTERMLSANLSTGALKMLGAKPLLGRLFTADEDKAGCAPVILLSESTWRNRFSADPHIIGQIMKLDGVAATIVGVMPASFQFPNNQQIWLPLGFLNSLYSDSIRTFDVIARLKPGVSKARAEEDLRLIQSRRPTPSGLKIKAIVMPFRNFFLDDSVQLSAAVLFVLSVLFVLVSCSNAANLAMIDFFGRRTEIATSAALGIPRWATIRHVCLQVFIVALVAAGFAILLLIQAAPYVHAALTQMLAPYWLEFSFEWHHVYVAVGLALFSTAVAAIVPAGYLLFVNSDQIIRNGAGASRGSGQSRWRQALLATQISLLTLLGVCAGLLIRSSYNLADNRLGFDPKPVFIGKMGVREIDFPTIQSRRALYVKIADEVSRLPGVVAATVTNAAPGYPLTPNCVYASDTAQLANDKSTGSAVSFAATEGFLNTLDIPLAAGTAFVRTLKTDGPNYAIINQSLADRLWPDHNVIGRPLYVRYSSGPNTPIETLIVRGIAQDFRASGLTRPQGDSIYRSFNQGPALFGFLLVRGEHGVPDTKTIQDIVRAVDSRVALYFPDSLQHQIDLTVSPLKLTTRLTSLYAIAAVILCAVGIYSLTVSQILQRSREFGIRMALGIDANRLWALFARGHFFTALCGVCAGLLISVPAAYALKSLLFGVNPYDLVTFIIVAASILLVSALACIPSLFRLRRIHPADCLRSL